MYFRWKHNSRFHVIGLLIQAYFSIAAWSSDSPCAVEFSRLLAPVSVSSEFTEKDVRLIKGVIARVQNFARDLQLPQVTVVEGKPSYLHKDRLLKLKMTHLKPDRLNSAVKAAHEYGHALFDTNLTVRFNNELVNPSEAMHALNLREEAIFNSPAYLAEANSLKEKINYMKANYEQLAPEDRKYRLLEEDLKYLPRKYADKEINDQRNILSEIIFSTMPHSELFADLVAVIAAKDGKAVAKALQPGGLDAPDKVVPWSRDFTKPVEVNGFRLTNTSFFESTELYEKFDPVRSHLWKHYLSKPEFKNHAALLKAFLAATATQVERNLAQFNPRLTVNIRLRLEDSNKELIELLDREMANTANTSLKF